MYGVMFLLPLSGILKILLHDSLVPCCDELDTYITNLPSLTTCLNLYGNSQMGRLLQALNQTLAFALIAVCTALSS